MVMHHEPCGWNILLLWSFMVSEDQGIILGLCNTYRELTYLWFLLFPSLICPLIQEEVIQIPLKELAL